MNLKGLQVDILRNEGHDLLKEEVWKWVEQQLKSGIVALLIAAPPCNTHSRARCQYVKQGGPRPLRSYQYPRGFPWLSSQDKAKVKEADELVDKAFAACRLALQHGGHFVLEHPEQLGKTLRQVPASIWDLQECVDLLAQKGVHTFAFFQCRFGAPSSKPTRFLTTLEEDSVGFHGLPRLDQEGNYQGPLPQHCPHGKGAHAPLVGKDPSGQWNTSPTATYPPDLCQWIASLAWPALLRLRGGVQSQPSQVEEKQQQSQQQEQQPKGVREPISRVTQQQAGSKETEEDSFHGCLEGALQEHKGMPMVCNWHARKPSSFNDGCGLCSPGRWPPARRNFQTGSVKEFLGELANLVKQFTHQYIGDTQRMFFALSLGKMTQAPFDEQALQDLRERWFSMLPDPGEARQVPEGQPFFLRAIAQTARLTGEEDADILDSGEDNYCEGRMVGYQHMFPRVPLVFRPKIKTRQYDDSEFKALNDNYSSAKEHAEQIEVQFQEEEKMGFMFPLSLKEATRRYGERMRVASLGAIPKGDGRVRVIFDATHFVQINNEIGIQDRLEFPGPEASATLMDVTLEAGHRLMIAVAADIALAHRRFKHREEDVGLLGCRVDEEGPIWFNRVGTFGVACAAYHFARLASLLGRLVMRLWGQAHVFQLLFADDLKMVAAGPRKYDLIWYMLITWIMVGAPFRWPKFRGGVCLDFVGFYMDYCKFEVGLSERRTAWIVNWVEEAQRNGGLVTHRNFVELVGRLVYAGQVLCWMKPFMAPLHAWKSAIAPGTVALLPQMVSVVLLFIAGMLKRGHHRTSGRSPQTGATQAFRTDAKCEPEKIVLGGWELGPDQDPRKARWFSLVVTAREAPWLFELGTAAAASTSAELLATLVALEVFGHLKGSPLPKKVLVEAGTDNLATEHISLKESSNKFPLAFVQMQLSLKCYLKGLVFRLQWRPRETNQEADDLTNEEYGKFDPKLRCKIAWEDLDWSILKELLRFREEVQGWKEAKRKLQGPAPRMSKKQKAASKTVW